MKFYFSVFFLENLSKKLKFNSNLTRITGTLREETYIYIYILILSHSFLLRTRNVTDKRIRENKKKHTFCVIKFSPKTAPFKR